MPMPRTNHAGPLVFLVLLLCLSTSPAALSAADLQAGRDKARMCTTCHGPLGIGQMPGVPNLAGQPEMYLRDQLKAFRSGTRVHQVMGVVAKGLSDQDIDHLSAWFGSLKISVSPP